MLKHLLCTLVALLTLIIVTIAWHWMSDPAFRYRTFGDEHSLRPAIARHIKNGDTMDHVQRVLGPGAKGSHTKAQAWTNVQIQGRERVGFAEQYPDDILPTDVFVAYSGFPTQFVLQFRDDRVINLPESSLSTTCFPDGG